MKKQNFKNTLRFFGKALGTLLLVCTLTAFFSAVGFLIYAKNGPELSVDEFCTVARAQDRTTRLYCISYTEENAKYEVIKETEELYAAQNRDWVKYGELPKELINAFVAIEDHEFFKHNGVSIRRTAGAMLGYISGKGSYGGSTITQQLIKNVTGNDDRSVNRKIKEIIKAYKLDSRLSKEEILELYLNTIYLSQGCYGVGSASRRYFEKDVSELTLAECASLACIPQSPSKWDPVSHPENNAKRRKTVLLRMAELGMISEDAASKAINRDIRISNKKSDGRSGGKIYSWYTESVIEESIRLLIENRLAVNRQTATKLLYTGGLKIITAVDPEMQAAVEKYFKETSDFYTEDAVKKTADGSCVTPECSIVVMDRRGRILALAGGIGEKKTNRGLNFATGTLRSPGSVIKPLSVYAPAIDCGILTYGSVIDDTPVKFTETAGGAVRGWPRNYPVGYRGLTTVRDAVARSVNTVAVKVLETVGTEKAFSLLHDGMKMRHLVELESRNGVSFTDKAVCPLALGQLTDGVSVAELTAGYTALCNGGSFGEGRTVLKILDSEGRLLINNSVSENKLFSPETAAIMTRLLQSVTSSGTASAMKMKNTVECAGKTGTSSNDTDRWYVGYTPDLLAGVWFGYPEPRALDGFSTSPSPALKTWDNVMKIINTEKYLGRAPKKHFSECDGLVTATYCRDSGKLMTAACACDPRGSRAETGYFTKDTVPTEYCDCHVLVPYDAVHGGVASVSCPRENLTVVGLLNTVREFPYDVTVSDAQYTYRALPEGVSPSLLSNEPFYLNLLPSGTFPGHSAVTLPFNRFCYDCYFDGLFDTEYYGDSDKNTEYEDAVFKSG